MIREMRRNDYSQVRNLLEQLSSQGEVNEQDFADFIFSSWHFRNTRVLEIDDKIVAVGSIYFLPKLKGVVGQIEDVVVDEKSRGKGYGERIMTELLSIASKKDCYKVILNCSWKNISFYKKVGFKWTEYQMRKNLS